MNISKRYTWQSAENCRENNPLLPQSLRGLVIGKSGCGKNTVIFNLILKPGWLEYNHLYIFGKSLRQQEYKILRKGFEGGLSKQQISNVFNSQEMLQSPLIVIENTVTYVMERYELNFTMIVRIFQTRQHWTLHKKICSCWTPVS